MKKIRAIHHAAAFVLALPMLFGAVPSAQAQVSVGVGISLPGVNIGINLPSYPQLVRVPGYPVYYAPSASNNYFFYDGLYWVYTDDNWYSSDWYDGPWALVQPAYVPVFVLRVPVRYYRQPPLYFRSWRADGAPRWGDHWGRDWESRRRGWDQWDRRSIPAAAPLPAYQRNYTGDRYPRAPEQQRELRAANYRYQPREAVSKQQFQRPVAPSTAAAPAQRDTRPDRADRGPDRAMPPPPRVTQRPQPQEGSQMERPAGQPDRPHGRPERNREQPVQAPPRPQPERAQAPQPEQARPQPAQRDQPHGPQGGPGRGADQANRGEASHDRGRGAPPEGRGRDKDK